jgi:hypothetical protein
MNWRPWRKREEQAASGAIDAALDAAAAAVELERVKARRPEVAKVNDGVRRETVLINGWTARAKRAMS